MEATISFKRRLFSNRKDTHFDRRTRDQDLFAMAPDGDSFPMGNQPTGFSVSP